MNPGRQPAADPTMTTAGGSFSAGDVFAALAETYLALVEAVLGSDTRSQGRDPDCVWGCTPVPAPDMNRVMALRLTGLPNEVEARIETVQRRFAGLAATWWLDPGTSPLGLAEILVRLVPGARRDWVPAMALQLAHLPAAEAAPEIQVRFAVGPDAMVAAEALAAEGFGALPGEAGPFGSMFARLGENPASPVRVAVARLAGRPVATALGCLAGEVLGIYNVATLPDVRGRGLGRAVTAALLREGIDRGARLAVLEATDAGLPVYRRLGFREVGHFEVITVPDGATL